MPAKDITYYTPDNKRCIVRVNDWEILACGALRLYKRGDPTRDWLDEKWTPGRTEIIAPGQWVRLEYTDLVYMDVYEQIRTHHEERMAGQGEL